MAIEAGTSTYYQAKRAIPQDGLIVCLDAGVKDSYNGVGASWRNLSSGSYNSNLYNTPTFTREYGGAIDFNGTDENSRYTITLPYALTVITWARSNLSLWNSFAGLGSARFQNGFILHNNPSSRTTSWYIMNGQTSASYAFLGAYNSITDIEIPIMYHFSTNGSNIHKFGINMSIATSSASVSRNESPTVVSTVNLGSDNSGSRYNNMKMYAHYLYNRQLSNNEIVQIYNSTRHRFGL